MRPAAILLVLLAVAAVSGADYPSMWGEFKSKYGKSYSAAEEVKRFNYFVENMKTAEALQSVNPKATFGVSPYADMSAKEFKVYHNGDAHYKAAVAQRGPELKFSAEEKKAAAGRSIDWRTKGAVTYVKNQGQCGSCWSFSTTGGIEGQWFLAGNNLTSLSEQELVSCDTIDQGCNGGLMQNAFKWLLTNKDGKIVTAASYPYVSGDGIVPSCDLTGKIFGAQINGHVDVAKDENDMATFVYSNGPLSIAVDATSFQTYTGGILTNCISNQIDHGVLIVGFDDAYTTPYWIIKNSWGPSWGEAGYIRVAKGSDQCLITSDPTSSTVKKSGPSTPAPQPPSPTPPSPPTEGTFKQLHCTDPNCQSCKTVTFKQGACINGGSFGYKGYCATDALIIETFGNSGCTGPSNYTSEPLNVCSITFSSNGLEHFVQNECPGSSPVPPSPPVPPTTTTPVPIPTTPSPTPASSTFTQTVCTDAACSVGCQSNTFPQNQCLNLQGGGSAIANCSSTVLNLVEYPLSSNCQGFSVPTTQPLNTCEQDSQGTYFETICSSSAPKSPIKKGTQVHHSSGVEKRLKEILSKRI